MYQLYAISTRCVYCLYATATKKPLCECGIDVSYPFQFILHKLNTARAVRVISDFVWTCISLSFCLLKKKKKERNVYIRKLKKQATYSLLLYIFLFYYFFVVIFLPTEMKVCCLNTKNFVSFRLDVSSLNIEYKLLCLSMDVLTRFV